MGDTEEKKWWQIFGGEEDEEKGGGLFGGLFNLVKTFFAEQFKQVWESLETRMSNIAGSAVKGVLHALGLNPAPIFNQLTNEMIAEGLISARDAAVMRKHADAWGNMAWFVYSLNILAIYFKRFMIGADMILADEQQRLASQLEPNLPDPNTAVRAAFIAPEKTGQIRDIMKRHGFKDSDIDLFFISQYRLYDVMTVRELYFRGVLDEKKVYERMHELGFTDTRIKEVIQSWEILPTMSDIVRYLAREVFEPRMIETFGLMEDYPAEAEEWAQKLGISKRWVKAEWVAHWEPPSLQIMLEGLHRGAATWDEVELYMRLVEIPPRFRELIKDMAYIVPTRVDTRRMHQLGVISDQELVNIYKAQGYDDFYAQKMAEFTIRYNMQVAKKLTKAEVLSGYREGALTEDVAKKLLAKLGYSETQAQYIIVMEDLKIEQDYQKRIVNNIKDRYVNNLIEDYEARDSLNKLDLPARQVNLYMDEWKIDKYLDMKLPSKTDLGKMYFFKVINEDSYRQQMQKLGYTYEQIRWYLDLMKKTKKPI